MVSFAKVPDKLVTDPSVSDMAVRVYAALRPHVYRFETYGEPLPPMAQVAGEIGRSIDSVQRCVRELEQAGWLARQRTGNKHVWIKLNNVLPKGAIRKRSYSEYPV